MIRGREKTSPLWEIFTPCDLENKIATCGLCLKDFSYKTTSTNLKHHLKFKHVYAHQQLEERLKLFKNENLQDDEESVDNDQTSCEAWNYFEQETGGRVRCVVCRTTVPNNVEDLKTHLEEDHPNLLVEVNQEETAASDHDSNKADEDNTFTEVIYLEDESKKSPKYVIKKENKPPKSVTRTSELFKNKRLQIFENKRRLSDSSDEMPVKKAVKNENELESFILYIKCLMKQLPKDTCVKLQLDIVNLIMNAKLSKTSDVDSFIVESERNRESSSAVPRASHAMSMPDCNSSNIDS